MLADVDRVELRDTTPKIGVEIGLIDAIDICEHSDPTDFDEVTE